MSYQIGIDAVHLRPAERLGHMEYCSNQKLIETVTKASGLPFHDAWEFDMQWTVNDGPVPWGQRGRVTDMGHAEFLEGGVDMRQPQPSPFKDAGEVLAFDAVAEYGLPDFAELVKFYDKWYQDGQQAHPNQLWPGGYYKTIVSGAIEAFGWDMLLLAAAEQERFEKVLDSIFRLSLHHYRAWAQTSIEVFICHDDMVWSEGPFIHPDFYRRVIFPRYKQLWAVLKEAGKKVLFCSDGNFTMFIDDLAQAGAEGFIFEPLVDFDVVVAKYGKTHFIAGSKVDCRTLTFSDKDAIRREVDATLELAFDCPGFVFAVGNHIPSNIPVENGLFYFDYLRKHWRR